MAQPIFMPLRQVLKVFSILTTSCVIFELILISIGRLFHLGYLGNLVPDFPDQVEVDFIFSSVFVEVDRSHSLVKIFLVCREQSCETGSSHS
jgi:hypothetical protein